MAKITNQDDQINDSPVEESQTKILKNLSKRLTDDYFNQRNFPLRTAVTQEKDEVEDINQYISHSSKRLAGRLDKDESKPNLSDNPGDFDGITGQAEEQTLLAEQIRHLERENLKLKHQLDLLQTDYQTEKRQLSSTIRDLKTELHRTAPLTENKFFTFSKDMREVVQAVRSLSDDDEFPSDEESLPETDFSQPIKGPIVTSDSPTKLGLPAAQSAVKIVTKPVENLPLESAENPISDNLPKSKKPKLTKKTKTIAAASTAVAIFAIGISLTFFGRKPPVDPVLVNSYLNSDGTVQGVSDTAGQEGSVSSPVRKENKNNEVSFADTDWQVFRDEFLGFQVRYPANATDLLHTGNTITFLRKDGYIFKMQRIATNVPLKDYWEKIQNDSLKYQVEPTKLGIYEAYHLVLDEPIEFPGNRYLVQLTDHIADIWYATSSAKIDPDDIKRAEYMKSSMTFL